MERDNKAQYTDPEKQFLQIIQLIAQAHGPRDVFRDFVILSACAISNSVDKSHFEEREKLYLSTIKQYDQTAQEQFPELLALVITALERNPRQDFLGKVFMMLGLRNSAWGQNFTPYQIAELMADVSMKDVSARVVKNGYVTINDPCCGAGVTLIAEINKARDELAKENLNFQNHVLVIGQDIDMTVLLMSYIQVSLLGVAGYFKVGDSLSDPIVEKDSCEAYWYTPMYYFPVWSMRRLFRNLPWA